MSNRALRWAFRLPITGAAKPVLLALADHFNDETGRCDPANGTLALFAGKDERTVRRALGTLQALGLITTTERRGRPSLHALAIGAAPKTPDTTPAPPRTPRPPTPRAAMDTVTGGGGHHARPTPDTVSGTPDTMAPKPI